MSPALSVDKALEQIEAGATLTREELLELADSPDILAVGMLADAQRRVRHGSVVTYLRVATCAFGALASPPPEAAGGGELRLTAPPPSLPQALQALGTARALAGSRTLAALTWADVVRYAESGVGVDNVLRGLHGAGLDALAEVALDGETPVDAVLGALSDAGFDNLRLHVARPGDARERVGLWCRVSGVQAAARVASVNPLPTVLGSFRPTTGYDDVKSVALARLALPGVAHLQVDWMRYGPKLAQVALTFGANDVDGVSASDEAPLGRRRAPLEEIRRNIEAAGFEPVERTGRFAVSGS
jgi:aminodeoxyfutalosine synthase